MKRISHLKKPLIRFWTGVKAHRILTAVIAVTVVFGGYKIYTSAMAADVAPQYVVTAASIGNIVQTVAGTGQVTALNQLDVTSKVSGAVTGIDVSVGQHVKAGDLIATIDTTDAAKTLESARLSYQKLVAPPKTADLESAENSVSQSYSNAVNNISGFLLDLHTIMPGLNSLFYGADQYLGTAASANLIPAAQAYRQTAGASYDKANLEYQVFLASYGGISRQSATSTVDGALASAYALSKDVANALQNAQNTIVYVSTNQPSYQSRYLVTAQSDVASWLSSANSDVSNLLSSSNSISSSENSLATLVTGADPLDVQSQQLSLQQAEETYADYFIRAPFDGVIGRLPTAIYSQAGGSAVIATVISDQKIANISLDEVDAAKVKVGQPVTITFNAINGFTATGTVAEVDLVGSVSSGVVAYGVKIAISTADPRILPGMSVNVSIVTMEKDGVLVVPTAAVKTQGNQSYVQILASSTVSAYLASQGATIPAGGRTGSGRSASSTSGFSGAYRNASTTEASASTTARYASFSGAASSTGTARTVRTATISLTIPSLIAPTNVVIVTGLADNTNTEVVSGIPPRTWIVTRTIAGSAAATAAPSILNTLTGGARTGAAGAGGGTFRAGGGGAGAAGAVRIGG